MRVTTSKTVTSEYLAQACRGVEGLCTLSSGGQRGRICLARGTVPCSVLFVGEAPGISEDTSGRVFDGPAGKLLDQIIERSLPKEITYALTNLVACFPRDAKSRGDNEPERSEILECRPRIVEFVNLARPRLIVRVGKLSTQYLNFDTTVPFVDIDHPAYIIRMPLAQQQMAVQKCIVQLRTALEDHVLVEGKEFTEWETSNASSKTPREHLRDLYSDAEKSSKSDS